MKTLKHRIIILAVVLLLLTVIFVVIAWIPRAKAQSVCGSRTAVVGTIINAHSESRTAAGVSGNGMLIELYENQDRTTWTLLMTTATDRGKRTCILSAGNNWHAFEPELESH